MYFLESYSATRELPRKELSGHQFDTVERLLISKQLACFCHLFDLQLSSVSLYHMAALILIRG